MKSILRQKSYRFAVMIIELYKNLVNDSKEYVLSKQVLRSGTAIGALVFEGEFAQSPYDLTNKFSIAVKEANESLYWLELLKETDYINIDTYSELSDYCKELIRMLVASIKTLKKNHTRT